VNAPSNQITRYSPRVFRVRQEEWAAVARFKRKTSFPQFGQPPDRIEKKNWTEVPTAKQEQQQGRQKQTWQRVEQDSVRRFSPARLATWRAFEVPWEHVSPLAIVWAIEGDRLEYWKKT
jgi:hypothetical protein